MKAQSAKPVVFLGPSLELDAARRLCDASFAPPVSRGDVCRAVDAGARVIGIVDGYYEWARAVTHKEILYALSRGVRVIGSSSMGALRAAELDQFGMTGVGYVYAQFASGRIEADDEMALLHAPADDGYRPLSLAGVNVRATLEAATSEGLISAGDAQLVIRALRASFYPDRQWPALLAQARSFGLPLAAADALARFARAAVIDAKRDDARLLLSTLNEGAGAEPLGASSWTFEPTSHFELLRALPQA
jgi:hypothetical protein